MIFNYSNIVSQTLTSLFGEPIARVAGVNLAQAQASDFFTNINNTDWVDNIKLISLIASLIFALLFIIIVRKLNKLSPAKLDIVNEISPPQPAGSVFQSRWEEIIRHISSSNESEWKFALIEADKLVDDTLKSAGFVGDTMGDRMMAIDKSNLVSLDGLWDAHKIRNRLVHDVNYFLRYGEAKRAIDLFEATLKELGAI